MSKLIKNFIKKPVRTISGVTPLTVVLKPKRCEHGECIYCPGGDSIPQSYTDKSPAIMRAMKLNYEPKIQVEKRLDSLRAMNHPTDKIELIILGGTFLEYPKKYQKKFIKSCFDALNGKKAKNLEEAKKINETAKNRCVAMCIENRPDSCSEKDIKRMLNFGATRVELGVQILDDKIYKKINRGHKIKDVIEATKRLKNAGFKVGYHIMPGLPFSSKKNDFEKFKLIFGNSNFRPDQLKIYPCQIICNSKLEKIYKKIKFKSYSENDIRDFLLKAFKIIPNYCRVMRVMREVPKEKILSEQVRSDLRNEVENELREKNVNVKEIRMREVGFALKNNSFSLPFTQNSFLNKHLRLNITKYKASDGNEYFLEIVNKNNILFGLLRLRLFKRNKTTPFTNASQFSKMHKKMLLKNSNLQFQSEKIAIIRELHIYGKSLRIGWRENQTNEIRGIIAQHLGFGKLLIGEAEKICKKNGFEKLIIISGVGVREYYRKLGYELKGSYMVKDL